MDLRISGKRALITGGSKGIGRAAAEALAAEGVSVILVARDASALDQAARDLRGRFQVQVETIAADLSDEAEVARVAQAAGDIDILVNNAGAIPPGDLLSVDSGTWRKAWDLKVFGFINLTRAVYPGLKAGGGGVVVNVIGAAGEKFPPGYITGATGNAALMAFTRALGKASPKDNIRVVAVSPGPVLTERHEMLARHTAQEKTGDAERWREGFASMPFGRPADPEEIGAAVAFLASPLSGYTTGTILTIDGAG